MRNGHYDAANFLLRTYDVILAPKFNVKSMAQHTNRVFGRKVARSMYNWSHYAFRQRLISKSFDYAGKLVIEVTEPGTSGTCGKCGRWDKNLGGRKEYACQHCGVIMDRDVNGARNNLLAAYGLAIGVRWDGSSD